LLCLGNFAAHAQTSNPLPASATSAATPAQALDQLGGRLDAVKAALKDKQATAPLADLRNAALGVQDQARQLASSLTPQMAALQAQLLNQNALQLAAQLTGLRNDEFQARLASRTATPFSAAFWADPARTFPDDLARLKRLGARGAAAGSEAWQSPNRRPLLFCLIGAALLLGVGRWL